MYWLNQQHAFKAGGSIFNGTITSLKNNGLLIVKNNKEVELEFNFKEIEFLNK